MKTKDIRNSRQYFQDLLGVLESVRKTLEVAGADPELLSLLKHFTRDLRRRGPEGITASREPKVRKTGRSEPPRQILTIREMENLGFDDIEKVLLQQDIQKKELDLLVVSANRMSPFLDSQC